MPRSWRFAAVDDFTLVLPMREKGHTDFIALHNSVQCRLQLKAVFLCRAGADDFWKTTAPCVLECLT